MKKHGFTLIEILISISIIAIIIGIVSVGLNGMIQVGKVADTRMTISKMMSFRTQVISKRKNFVFIGNNDKNEVFHQMKDFAPDLYSFDTVDQDGDGIPEIIDAWGNVIRVERGGIGLQFLLISAGPDGEFYTDDDITSENVL